MKKHIVGISGLKTSGKTTLAKYLEREHGFQRLAFAGNLKKAAAIIFRLSHDQLYDQGLKEKVDERWDMAPRKILELLGAEIGRQIDDRVWIKSVMLSIEDSDHDRFVIEDCRFTNEADAIRASGGRVLGIQRPGLLPSMHPSETEMWENWSDMIDTTVVNSSTKEELFCMGDIAIQDWRMA